MEKKAKTPKEFWDETIKNIWETLVDVNQKLDELKKLEKGNKFLVILGWLMMCSSGAVLFLLMQFAILTNSINIIGFFGAFVGIGILMLGYSFAHKGLTGFWL